MQLVAKANLESCLCLLCFFLTSLLRKRCVKQFLYCSRHYEVTINENALKFFNQAEIIIMFWLLKRTILTQNSWKTVALGTNLSTLLLHWLCGIKSKRFLLSFHLSALHWALLMQLSAASLCPLIFSFSSDRLPCYLSQLMQITGYSTVRFRQTAVVVTQNVKLMTPLGDTAASFPSNVSLLNQLCFMLYRHN